MRKVKSLDEIAKEQKGYRSCLEVGQRIAAELGFFKVARVLRFWWVPSRALDMWMKRLAGDKRNMAITLHYDYYRCFSSRNTQKMDFGFHLKIWITH